MSSYLTYSILQYKHNLVLGEILNIGILFYFPDENHFQFVSADGYRAKAIYPDFDSSIFHSYLKAIRTKVKDHIDIFNERPTGTDFAKYLQKNILAEDAAGLIFNEAVTVKNVFGDINEAINEYSKLLLPGVDIEKPSIIKHNENYILKIFNGYIFGNNKSLESKFKKNETIKTNHVNLKFDLFWQKKTNNYLKPINFDFADEVTIQTKAATYFGYITGLGEYASSNNARFVFLVTKPQTIGFNRAYENALDFLSNAKAPKRIVTEDELASYSENVLSEILTD